MRAREILTEAAKVGRNLQHLEDLVFIEGSAGAMEALNILERFGKDVSDVSIKWDGTPAVIFGRDAEGEFILTDVAGFNSKSYDGRVKSADALHDMLLNRGKEVDDNRRAFAQAMANIWPAFESATPADFRGFIHGDLLYNRRPPVDNGQFVFKPNKVTYRVRTDSNIGQRIANSDVGVVIHTHTDFDGNITQADANTLIEGALFIMPPVISQQPAQIDVNGINELRNYVRKNARIIDALLQPQPGLSDIKNIVYTYVNQMSRAGRWDELPTGFADWLTTSKVSPNKQAKLLAMPESKNFPLLFDIVLKVQAMKNNVIDQLDNASLDVESSIDGDRGGEGYVAARDKVKLVPRHKFRIG